MEFLNKYFNTVNTIIFIISFGLITWLLPVIALFGFRGAESEFNQRLVSFYQGFASIAVIVIIAARFNQWFIKGRDKVYKAIGWFGSIIHNPEMSILYDKKAGDFYSGFKWMKKKMLTLWIITIFFSILGIFQVLKNTFFVDLPQITQQILPVGQAILAVEPAGSEIFGLTLLVSINLYFWRWMQSKYKFDDVFYWVISIITSLIVGVVLYGLPLHFFVYGSSDTDLIGIAFFWAIATILILLFANIFIVWIYKDINNLFKFLNGKYSDDNIIIATSLVITFIFLIGMFIIIYRNSKKQVTPS